MAISIELKSAIRNVIKKDDVVVVAPLNWGLGHASRSIVIVEYLRLYVKKVVIASDGVSGILLQKEFPTLTYYEIDSPEIRYESTSMIVNGLKNGTSLINHLRTDKRAANNIVNREKATVIISDNRFGFKDDRCTNIYITHQLSINTGNTLFSAIVSRWHRSIINYFDLCWVPDYEKDKQSIAGRLSRKVRNTNVTYIEPLSRIERLDLDKTVDILILLSGPEPQRTFFENVVVRSLEAYIGKVELIRGTIKKIEVSIPANWNVKHIASSHHVNQSINTAKRIICRSGYSTLMDLAAYSGRILLVPTPGQGEQEYLATFHGSKDNYATISQDQITEKSLSILLDL